MRESFFDGDSSLSVLGIPAKFMKILLGELRFSGYYAASFASANLDLAFGDDVSPIALPLESAAAA